MGRARYRNPGTARQRTAGYSRRPLLRRRSGVPREGDRQSRRVSSGFDARSSCPTTRVPLLPDRARRGDNSAQACYRRGEVCFWGGPGRRGRPGRRPPHPTTPASREEPLAVCPEPCSDDDIGRDSETPGPLSTFSRPAIRRSGGTCEERFASLTGARAGPWARRASRVSSYIRLGSPSRRLPLGRGAVKDRRATVFSGYGHW